MQFSGLICRAERPIAFVASENLSSGISISDTTVEIVAEEKPSLMGNVIDLSPGEEHYQITEDNIGLVTRNVDVAVRNVIDASGAEIKVRS